MEFKLSAEDIQKNYSKFFQRISKLFPERETALKEMYRQLGDERITFAPASSIDYYHNAFPGGYIDHVLRVMDFALLEYKHYEQMGLDVSNFTVQELMFAAMHHDLGKLGFIGDGKESYMVNNSEWHRKNQGKLYESNEHIPFAMVQDRSLFLLQQCGVAVSWNEYLAIRIHDGIYDKANESYFFAKQLKSKLRSNIVQILHNADLAASRFEFERWNKHSNRFNTSRIENPITVAVKKQETSKPLNKTAKISGDLSNSFTELFGA